MWSRDGSSPARRERTPHHLSSGFLADQRWIEGRAGSEHGTGDVEQVIGDRSQRTCVIVPAASERGVFGPACRVVLHGDAGPMVDGVGQALIAGISSDNELAFA